METSRNASTFQRSLTRNLNTIHYFVCGHSEENIVSPGHRCWRTHLFVCAIVIPVSSLSCVLAYGNGLTLGEHVHNVTPVAIMTLELAKIIAYRFFLKDMANLLRSIDSHFGRRNGEFSRNDCVLQLKPLSARCSTKFLTICTALSFVFFVIAQTAKFYACEEFKETIFAYAFGFVGYKRIQSVELSTLIFTTQMALLYPWLWLFFHGFYFFTSVIVEFRNECLIIRETLREAGNVAVNMIDTIGRQELSIERVLDTETKVSLRRSVLRSKAKCYEEFERNVVCCVKRYQNVANTVKLCIRYLRVRSAIECVAMPLLLTLLGNRYPWTRGHRDQACLNAFGTYILCLPNMLFEFYAGHVISHGSEDIFNEIYSISWYEMPPKVRQTLHVFRGHLRYIERLRIFDMNPNEAELYSRICKFMYTHIPTLITIIRILKYAFDNDDD